MPHRPDCHQFGFAFLSVAIDRPSRGESNPDPTIAGGMTTRQTQKSRVPNVCTTKPYTPRKVAGQGARTKPHKNLFAPCDGRKRNTVTHNSSHRTPMPRESTRETEALLGGSVRANPPPNPTRNRKKPLTRRLAPHPSTSEARISA